MNSPLLLISEGTTCYKNNCLKNFKLHLEKLRNGLQKLSYDKQIYTCVATYTVGNPKKWSSMQK